MTYKSIGVGQIVFCLILLLFPCQCLCVTKINKFYPFYSIVMNCTQICDLINLINFSYCIAAQVSTVFLNQVKGVTSNSTARVTLGGVISIATCVR